MYCAALPLYLHMHYHSNRHWDLQGFEAIHWNLLREMPVPYLLQRHLERLELARVHTGVMHSGSGHFQLAADVGHAVDVHHQLLTHVRHDHVRVTTLASTKRLQQTRQRSDRHIADGQDGQTCKDAEQQRTIIALRLKPIQQMCNPTVYQCTLQ